MTKRASERRFKYSTVRGPTASRQDEVRERLQLLRQAVHQALEGGDVPLLDARRRQTRLLLFGNAEVRAEMEEVVLDLSQHRSDRVVDAAGERQSDLAVQFVHRAVGLDARRVLSDPSPGAQARRAVVAGPRVDLRDARHQNLTSRPPATSLPAAGYPAASSY